MKKIISAILAILVLTALFTLAVCASGVTITETVNVAAARQNLHGHGYEWANRTSTLTLSGVNIDTKSDYGLRLPGECTVVLEGNNYVRASKYAISCAGNVTFKGKGTLTVDAGEYGFYLISQDNTTRVHFLSGEYKINAGKCGVFSEYTDFSVSGGSFDIATEAADGRAIMGRVANIVGGSFKANSAIECSHSLLIDSVNIDVDAQDAALSAKNLAIRHLDNTEYGGENAFHAKAVKRWHSKSILFGANVAGWVDYAVLLFVICAIAACIVVPSLRKKKKKKELYERLKAEGYDTFGKDE